MSDNAEFQRMAQEAYAVDWVAGCGYSRERKIWQWRGSGAEQQDRERWSIARLLFFTNRYIVEAMLILYLPYLLQDTLLILSAQRPQRIISQVNCKTVVAEFECALEIDATATAVNSIYGGWYGGVGSLVGLTITDYVADSVTPVDDFAVMPGCYAASVPGIIAGYWIAPVIVESLFFGLIAFRLVSWWLNDRHAVPPTLILLARDSTIYFTIIFVLLITNLFMFEYAPPFLSSLMVTPVNTAGCIAVTAIFLFYAGQSSNQLLLTSGLAHVA
ncbi:hypothetical protein FIBSPDRAFT_1008001 [Athelia psychrophila]|uniref:Uncharacterized protein n=1 Tax=Athelia psychrophila TaxID=1759441 RepID=A0A166P6E6_9AGAM|nr:hypothetical protein FIBSPDRAFT_1008001 [Fibularhizoctonia sp. CBS 109695]